MIKDLPAAILSYLLEESTDAVLIMDVQGIVRYVNPAMTRLSGYGGGELIGQSVNGLLPDHVARAHDTYVDGYVMNERPSAILGRVRELELRHRTGEIIPIELKAVDLGVSHGTRYFGAFLTDLRRRKSIEAKNAALMSQLEKQALTDPLTGLPNRRAFDLEASRVMANAKREHWPVVVGVADIDWFKRVNDQYGHAAGDAVLRTVAAEVLQQVRAGDLFGRIGGEEFGLLLPHATVEQALPIAERIRAKLAEHAIEVNGGTRINVTISIGLALVNNGSPFEAALAQADGALYQAKLTGRNRVMVAQT